MTPVFRFQMVDNDDQPFKFEESGGQIGLYESYKAKKYICRTLVNELVDAANSRLSRQ